MRLFFACLRGAPRPGPGGKAAAPPAPFSQPGRGSRLKKRRLKAAPKSGRGKAGAAAEGRRASGALAGEEAGAAKSKGPAEMAGPCLPMRAAFAGAALFGAGAREG